METQYDLFTHTVRAGGRTYFMNVKETKEGKPYLALQESRKKDEGFEKTRMLVFQDHLQEFINGLNSVQEFIQKRKPSDAPREMAPTTNGQEGEDLPF